jgi:hypothetical protein
MIKNMSKRPQRPRTPRRTPLNRAARTFYRHGLSTLNDSRIPFLVGGAYAFAHYTGIIRHTKDIDIFVHPRDSDRALQTLGTAGYNTDLTFPHWLGKAFSGEHFIDVIFSSGNGLCRVDDEWFEHAIDASVLDLPVRLCPPEEMIWSKAFVKERERYDGADVAHILQACGTQLAWPRLLQRFDTHWRVLLSHLVLFGFVYPAERTQIPEWVMQELIHRLQNEMQEASPEADRLCQGTLLSRGQYLSDVMSWGYRDARLLPRGPMTKEEVAHWTAAMDD